MDAVSGCQGGIDVNREALTSRIYVRVSLRERSDNESNEDVATIRRDHVAFLGIY